MAYVATIVPAFINSPQRVDYFRKCLQSITKQTAPTVGIIVDDNSPGNYAVKELVASENGTGNLRYVHRQKRPDDLHTASNALNFGIDLALSMQGEVFTKKELENLAAVTYLHSDDSLTGNANAVRLDGITNNDFVYTNLFTIDTDGNLVRKYGCGNRIAPGAGSVPHHTSMWTVDTMRALRAYVQDTYNQEGVFDPEICFGEDRDVTLSTLELISRNRLKKKYIDAVTYLYRLHPLSITGETADDDVEWDMIQVEEKHGIDRDDLKHIWYNLTKELPWSLGSYLPDSIKKPFRVPRDAMRKFIVQREKPKELVDVL